MKTLWGYDINTCLPPLLTPEAFDEFTANKYAGDYRIGKELEAASAAVRNYVGWHLWPSADCTLKMTMQDGRVTRVGVDILVQLPAKYVTSVTSVTIGGTVYDFSFETNGILRIYDVLKGYGRKTEVEIVYTAGLPDSMMQSIGDIMAHRVIHALASPNGVTNETAGGVSITYNANWINNAQATALPDDNKEVLAPYRCQGVF